MKIENCAQLRKKIFRRFAEAVLTDPSLEVKPFAREELEIKDRESGAVIAVTFEDQKEPEDPSVTHCRVYGLDYERARSE